MALFGHSQAEGAVGRRVPVPSPTFSEKVGLGQQLLLPQLTHPQPRLRNADRQFRICATLITELDFCALQLVITPNVAFARE
jgi:hypothetical protein